MKQRLIKGVKPVAILLAIGFAYVIIIKLTGFGLPCIFNSLTGLKCPGCGISRMFLSLLRLDFAAAFRWNGLIFAALPVVAVLYIYHQYRYVRYGEVGLKGWENVLSVIGIILLLAFGIIRNL